MDEVDLTGKQAIATDTWSQVDIRSSDITAIMINTGKGKVLLVNMSIPGEIVHRWDRWACREDNLAR